VQVPDPVVDPSVPPGAAASAVGTVDASAEPSALVGALSLDERIGLLSGDGPFWRSTLAMAKRYNGEPIVAGEVPRLGLPGIRFTDGPRGVVMYRSTAFPSPMARAATFDPDLEARIGDAIGVEARTQGANLFAGVCINALRHPAWGRAQETYGEDGHLLGELGAALTRGVRRHVMACVKHFAANSMENSRLWVDVRVAEADLRDLYLPHFRRVVDEGVDAVMTAYNGVNGSRCGHHAHLIGDVLKGEWGFDGFVMSDFTFGLHSARAAVLAGLDLEMPYEGFFKRLRGLVRRGRVPVARIDDAAERLVRAQVRLAGRGEPGRYRLDAVAGPEHRALAREAAARSIVLLRNEPVAAGGASVPALPLGDEVRSVAVIGGLADRPNLGDLGSSQVHPREVITLLEGLREAAEGRGVEVRHDDGRDPGSAASLAAGCDAAIVVAGSTFRDEGEWILRAGGDRRSLRLREPDEALLREVGAANPRTAAVLMGGSAFAIDPWVDAVAAVAMCWYPGMEGGRAVADVVFGDRSPEGRLPCTWPTTANRLPPFERFARRFAYGPLFGYRLFEATGQRPAFWFGHGLAYTEFAWGDPVVDAVEPGAVTLAVPVTNTGDRAGVEVVQAYVAESLGTEPRALGTLRAATRVVVAPGETVVARLLVPLPPSGPREVRVGRCADPAAQAVVAISAR
jgi:beta-glucosidase